MYENGKQLNRYANKMLHKRKMKISYIRAPYNWSYTSWEDYIAHLKDYDSTDYWRTCYLSGSREYARYLSRKKLRQIFRQEVCKKDFDEIYAPQYGDYKRYSEFWWVVF